jgi:hypothetical protein
MRMHFSWLSPGVSVEIFRNILGQVVKVKLVVEVLVILKCLYVGE